MQVYTVDEVRQNREQMLKLMRSSVFIYPTDNMYVLGCNAMIQKSVERVRNLKPKLHTPFAVIVPSVDWIRDNCEITPDAEEWLDKLPGPYTLQLRMKNKDILDSGVLNGSKTIGVRMPDHWITQMVAELGYPVVSTSANHVGDPLMNDIDALAEDIKQEIDFLIDEGEKQGAPYRLIKLHNGE
jgi:L-threonylcarbamoyladenylate synthase